MCIPRVYKVAWAAASQDSFSPAARQSTRQPSCLSRSSVSRPLNLLAIPPHYRVGSVEATNWWFAPLCPQSENQETPVNTPLRSLCNWDYLSLPYRCSPCSVVGGLSPPLAGHRVQSCYDHNTDQWVPDREVERVSMPMAAYAQLLRRDLLTKLAPRLAQLQNFNADTQTPHSRHRSIILNETGLGDGVVRAGAGLGR